MAASPLSKSSLIPCLANGGFDCCGVLQLEIMSRLSCNRTAFSQCFVFVFVFAFAFASGKAASSFSVAIV